MNRFVCSSTSRCRVMLPLVLFVSLVMMAAGCGKTLPGGPTGPIVSMVIAGTTAVRQPADTSQLNAMATHTDGVVRDVTTEVAWSSSDPRVMTVSQSGLVTGIAYGRTQITANHTASRVSVKVDVQVVPPGAFLVTGIAADQGFPVADVRVTCTSALGVMSTVTDYRGKYVLPATGTVTVRAEKDGYAVVSKELAVDSDQEVNLDLQRTNPPPDEGLLGGYKLTFVASPSCTTLPAAAMRRMYHAEISATSSDGLVVKLSGADFVGWGNDVGFTGTRAGGTLRFDITDDMFESDWAVVEAIPGIGYLGYVGTATGTKDNGRIVATFNGEFRLGYGSPTPATCRAADHQMVFLR